jgi:hypothetical protein
MRSYNLFRLKGRESMCCAVPEDHVVPAFLTDRRWSFGGRIDGAEALRGFDGRAAATGVRFNGFYLFQSFEARAHA